MDNSSRTTILVVDDRAINREFLVMLLGYAGYRVLEAADGAEALDKVRSERPALVITDVLMPTMDGIEFAHRLHAESEISRIPLIFYTATYRLNEARMLAQSCGVETVLAKPAEPQVILDAVAAVLGVESAMAEPADLPDQPGDGSPELTVFQHRKQQAFGTGIKLTEADKSPHGADRPTNSLPSMHALNLRIAALLELSITLSSVRNLQHLLELFCGAAQDIMNAKYAAVGMSANGQPRRSTCYGMTEQEVDAIFDVLEPRTGMLHEVLVDGKSIRSQDMDSDPKMKELAELHPLHHQFLIAPITFESQPHGWLYLADKLGGEAFNDDDEQFAVTLAAQLAPAYENLVLDEEVQLHAGQLKLETLERKRVADDLQESETRFRQLAENVQEVFFLMNAQGTEILYISPAYEVVWGRSCESLYQQPQSWMESIHPDDLETVRKGNQEREQTGYFDYTCRIVRSHASLRWVRVRGFPIRNDAGEVYRIAGFAEDITQQTEQQRKIARLSRISTVLSGINSAIVRIHDRNELFQEACRVAVDHGGFGMAWVGMVDPDTLEGKVEGWRGCESGYAEKIRLTARAGAPDSERPACVAMRERRPVICNNIETELTLLPLRAELLERGHQSAAALPLIVENRVVGVIALYAGEVGFFDEEELQLLNELAGDLSFGLQYIEKKEKLSYLAYYDVLTGLPNSMLFHDRLTQFLHGARDEQGMITVIMVDLVHFSQLNDALGHHVGDALLQQVAERFNTVLREPYTLARIGGNTFAFAVTGLRQGTNAASILERIFESFNQQFTLDQQEIRVSARGGLVLYPEDGRDAETLIKHAEVALNKAKSSDERYLYYAPQMNVAIAARLALENDLRIALETWQFAVYYQPRVDLLSGRIISAEALIRWPHPQRGMISPVQFIPLAEETGMIVPIGAKVINAVCAQQMAWLAQQIEIVPVAVNLSSVQFKRGEVLQTIRDAIELHQLKQHYIEFELTESVVMDNPEEATRDLQALKQLGVKLALDDFGTGYSSLAYLKRFPFDFVKIDRAFVTDITTSKEDAALANAIIAMAHGLNLRVVAEGVETEEQLNYLRKQGCDELQGYYFSPPVPAEAFASMLREGKRLVFAEELGQRHASLRL